MYADFSIGIGTDKRVGHRHYLICIKAIDAMIERAEQRILLTAINADTPC